MGNKGKKHYCQTLYYYISQRWILPKSEQGTVGFRRPIKWLVNLSAPIIIILLIKCKYIVKGGSPSSVKCVSFNGLSLIRNIVGHPIHVSVFTLRCLHDGHSVTTRDGVGGHLDGTDGLLLLTTTVPSLFDLLSRTLLPGDRNETTKPDRPFTMITLVDSYRTIR